MTIEDLRDRLRFGDLAVITELTIKRGLNNGKGFSYNYVQRVLEPTDPRTNDDILAIAREIVDFRETMAHKTVKA